MKVAMYSSRQNRLVSQLTLVIPLLALAIQSCGGGDGSSVEKALEASDNGVTFIGDDPDNQQIITGSEILTGIFVDSVVIGLSYTTATIFGETDENGQFNYQADEEITFTTGNIVWGQAPGAEVISPLDFNLGADSQNHPEIINRLRLLQTLDADDDLENGITISEETRTAADEVSIDFSQPVTAFAADSNVIDFILKAKAVTELVREGDALEHFTTAVESRNLQFPGLEDRVYKAVLHLNPEEQVLNTFTDTITLSSDVILKPQSGTRNNYSLGLIEYEGVRQTDLFSELGTRADETPSRDVTAEQIARALEELDEIEASAYTQAILIPTEQAFADDLQHFLINGITISRAENLAVLAKNIQAKGFEAILSPGGTQITVIEPDGENLHFNGTILGANTLKISDGISSTMLLRGETNPDITVGGSVTITKPSYISLINAFTSRDNIWTSLSEENFVRTEDKPFDPEGAGSYNTSEQFDIEDSFGNTHLANIFFVKEPLNEADQETDGEANIWSMYVTVADQNVGGTDPDEPVLARYILDFDEFGKLTSSTPSRYMIANWKPSYNDEDSAAPLGPKPQQTEIADPPDSSNFIIDISSIRFSEFGL